MHAAGTLPFKLGALQSSAWTALLQSLCIMSLQVRIGFFTLYFD